jgi:hypothetical protein
MPDEPVHIRLRHPLVLDRQLIQLFEFARIGVVELQVRNRFLDHPATPR